MANRSSKPRGAGPEQTAATVSTKALSTNGSANHVRGR